MNVKASEKYNKKQQMTEKWLIKCKISLCGLLEYRVIHDKATKVS